MAKLVLYVNLLSMQMEIVLLFRFFFILFLKLGPYLKANAFFEGKGHVNFLIQLFKYLSLNHYALRKEFFYEPLS